MKWKSKCLLCLASLISLSLYAMWSAKFPFPNVKTARQALIAHPNRAFRNVNLRRLREIERNKFYASIERRQRKVKRRLADYCHANPLESRLPRLYRFHVIKSPPILYCMVPKVASRQWRKTLKQLRLQSQQVRTTLKQYNATEISDYFSRSYKFMFVREPFERLLSAYKDKFLLRRTVDHRFLETYGRKIIAKFRPNATQQALRAGNDVTFPEFIEYILKDGVHEGLNWHWNTYDDQCRPCKVSYNFIGRFEFLSEDANYVLRKTGTYNLTSFPIANYSNTRRELLKYYSQIPLEWILQLGRVYLSSFAMFGYPFPGPLEALFRNATGMNVSVKAFV